MPAVKAGQAALGAEIIGVLRDSGPPPPMVEASSIDFEKVYSA
jgi:hypothetical protein